MRSLLASCAIAFSTYSRLPMPQVDWNEKNMRHTLAFLPLVGAAVGLIFWLVYTFTYLLGFGGVLRAALLTAVPLVVTGGIHMDGYCDTVDALSSHAPREKKLQILKDPNAGAFAVIWCGLWLLVYFGFMTQCGSREIGTVAAGFILTRAFSAFAVDRLPSAREGMGAVLKKGSKFPFWMLLLYMAVYGLLVFCWGDPLEGGIALFVLMGFYFIYRHMAMKEFGGFTGDLAGWYLQVEELLLLATVVIVERVCAIWCW